MVGHKTVNQMRKTNSGLRIKLGTLAALLVFVPAIVLYASSSDVTDRGSVSEFRAAPSATPKKKRLRHLKTKMNTIKHIPKSTPVAAGPWGAPGIIFSVEEKIVRIEYDCAEGEIPRTLVVDEHGNFKVDGFHTRHAGGPIRLDDPPKRMPATYEGKISGATMTLKITLANGGGTVGEYALERGKNVRLHRCY